ncbi:hypothetical protein QAD02_001338 [Eretmocerus hayati]|uniref:Uncharacterized protein n=1 Tax=Eretmocerus hayati TaxID=131215 RepID=A0ACC2NG56_9HYME|nr:hypothetical protein QAD02_001338 [Eretmocerus hayati]
MKICPNRVVIESNGEYLCDGTLLSPYFIITSAECMKQKDPWLTMKIKINADSTLEGAKTYAVGQVMVHENFTYTNFHTPVNNIALIRLNEPIRIQGGYKALNLIDADKNLDPGDEAYTCSSGGIKRNEENSKKHDLRQSDVLLVDRAVCNETYASVGGLADDQICAGYYGFRDTNAPCYGDLGSPLIIDNELVGMSSWVNDCHELNKPAVFTDIWFHLRWIYSHIDI